jgi:hypothetical protein
MNKIINKNILIQSIKSYDDNIKSKKISKPIIHFNDFLKDYYQDGDTKDLSKYVSKKN